MSKLIPIDRIDPSPLDDATFDLYAKLLGTRADILRESFADARRWYPLYGGGRQMIAFLRDEPLVARVRPAVVEGRPEPGVYIPSLVDRGVETYARRPLDVEIITAWFIAQAFDPTAVEWSVQPWTQHEKRATADDDAVPASQRCIYFIRAMHSGRIKIGTTAGSPFGRLQTFLTGSPEPLELAATTPATDDLTEAALHRRFANARVHGEWFHPTPELLAFISEIS